MVAGVIGGVVLAAAAALGVYVGIVKLTNKDFYSRVKHLFKIPELYKGFDAQDLSYAPEERIWLVSGYMATHRPSPIMKVHEDGTYEKIIIELLDGTIYHGHGAGVCVQGSYAYLTVNDGYVVLRREELMEAKHNSTVKAIAHRKVPLKPAFMTIHNGVFYIGEFYHRVAYPTLADHWMETSDGTKNPALVFAYEIGDEFPYEINTKASAVYSIPGDIQGMTISEDGRIVLSKSWGLGNSTFFIYSFDKVEASERGTFDVDGSETPIRFLEKSNLLESLRIPPMAEGIEAIGNRIYMVNEASSNLYLLGKFYDAKHVFSFDLY